MAKDKTFDELKNAPSSPWTGIVDSLTKQLASQHHVSVGSAYKPSTPSKLEYAEGNEPVDKYTAFNQSLENIQNISRTNEDGSITVSFGKGAKQFKNKAQYDAYVLHSETVKEKPHFAQMPDGSIVYGEDANDLNKEKLTWETTYRSRLKKNEQIADDNKKVEESIIKEKRTTDLINNGITIGDNHFQVSQDRAKDIYELEGKDQTELLNDKVKLTKFLIGPSTDEDGNEDPGSKEYQSISNSDRELIKMKIQNIDYVLGNQGGYGKSDVIVISSADDKHLYTNAGDDQLITINGRTQTKRDWEIEKNKSKSQDKEIENTKNNDSENDSGNIDLEDNIKPPPRPHVVIESEDVDFDMDIDIEDSGPKDDFTEYEPPVFGPGSKIKRQGGKNKEFVFGELPDGTPSWIYVGDDWENKGKNNIMNAVNYTDYWEDKEVDGVMHRGVAIEPSTDSVNLSTNEESKTKEKTVDKYLKYKQEHGDKAVPYQEWLKL